MASRWRRRQPCLLEADGQQVAVIRRIGASAAFLETNARPPLGQPVVIRHPDAGTIAGRVVSHALDGIGVALGDRSAAVAFALAVLASDCSTPD